MVMKTGVYIPIVYIIRVAVRAKISTRVCSCWQEMEDISKRNQFPTNRKHSKVSIAKRMVPPMESIRIQHT